jgi:outer membrane receptor protein involved in Fe transport
MKLGEIMKKMISATAICLSLLTSVQADESYIDYVSLGLAIQSLQNANQNVDSTLLNDKTGLAIVANVGKNLFDDISLEFEGSASVDNPQWTLGDATSDVDFWSLGIYGAYIWRINNLSIKPRVGLVYENIKATIGALSLIDKSDMALSGGVGLAYHFNNNYSIYSNYTKFEDDINHLTFGAEYKF